ncbi:MAG: hypothetical protein H6705_16800 [Myxococcales bacterium]|nr:hypothetical protein [Myxococcales bacterium]
MAASLPSRAGTESCSIGSRSRQSSLVDEAAPVEVVRDALALNVSALGGEGVAAPCSSSTDTSSTSRRRAGSVSVGVARRSTNSCVRTRPCSEVVVVASADERFGSELADEVVAVDAGDPVGLRAQVELAGAAA